LSDDTARATATMPRLALALALPFLAWSAQWLLWDVIKPYVWFLFFPAAFFSAWLGGLRGGMAGTLISAVLVWYAFIPPALSFRLDDPGAAFSIAMFVVMGSLFAYVFERLHRAQQRSDTRFETTFDQAAVGMALLAQDGRWLRVNRRLCDITGYSEGELLARTFQQITDPDDLAATLANAHRLLAGEIGTFAMEKRYLRKDGSVVWVATGVAMVRKVDGSPDYFISAVTDIQARKTAELALQQSEAERKEAERLAGLGHWHWNLQTDEHTWSEEIYRIYGRDPALPPARYPEVQAYFTPKSWADLTAAVERGLRDGVPYVCDAETAGLHGPSRWITARGEALRDAQAKVIALRGTVQDITERKRAELALTEGKRQYRELVQNANSVIIHWARDGTITFFNEYAEAFFGWRGDEIVGRHVNLLVPEQESTGADLTGLAEDIAAHPERYLSNVNENVCRDGHRVWMTWSNRALRGRDGRVESVLAVGSDISELKRAQAELQRRNDELERFHEAALGREMEMIDLKRRVNALSQRLNEAPPFDLSFTDPVAAHCSERTP
jgi:PAS domain S-box-containing protein